MTAAAAIRTRPARRTRGCEGDRAPALPGAGPTLAGAESAPATVVPTPAGGTVAGAAALPTLFDDLGGEPTPEDLVSGVWEGLAVHHRAACPLCGGEMVAAFGAHARPTEGRCADCGTVLT
jgi:hypothetical protein